MLTNREFSHITVSSTPFKTRMDKDALKTDSDIEKDAKVAYKCAERFNYNTNFLRKVSLSDRLELAALGFELKGKTESSETKVEQSKKMDYIYRKDKRQDFAGSPLLPSGMSPTNPLPAGRGFLSPIVPATSNVFAYSGSSKNFPLTSSSSRKPIRSIFDDIPVSIA